MDDKIHARYLERLAVVYVRQSRPDQIRHNLESRRRQRDLKQRACELGWPEQRICVLTEEKAKSASATEGRRAYHELAEGVVNGRVGLILAVEVSRWSRDNAAWQLLLRDCVFADVLLADEHKVYDVNDPHDRVFLGIQGVLAEYELGLLRKRMHECWWNKARRGEMFTSIATGYVEVRGKGLEKHPNQRVQHSLDRLFEKFQRMPSVIQLCQWYLRHEELLPYLAHGDDPHQVQWLPANYSRLLWMLKNPVYAGAYVIGRTQTVIRRNEDGELVRHRRVASPDQWQVLEKGRFPAYISWEQYERNLAKIRGNANMKGEAAQPAPHRGPALLAGLLRCGRCGRKLVVHYDPSGEPRYVCRGGRTGRERQRQRLSLSGRRADPLFSQALLEAVYPAGIKAAVRAGELAGEEYRRQEQRLTEELKQQEYEAERVQRQYDRVEPENRLVASELEQRWNDALSKVAVARARLTAFRQQQEAPLSESETRRLMSLGHRLDMVWNATDTDVQVQKQIAHLLVEEVIVRDTDSPNTAELWIHWSGGHHTSLVVPRRSRMGRGHTAEAKMVIRVLHAVCDDQGLANALNRNGVRNSSGTWTADLVRRFREQHGIPAFDPSVKESEGLLTGEEASRLLGISPMSVHRLVQRNILPADQPAAGLPFVIYRSDLSLEAVQEATRRIQLNLPRPLPDDPNQLRLF